MAKKAYLVYTTFITRIISDKDLIIEDISDEDVASLIEPKLRDKINNHEILENIEVILEDRECPYDPEEEKRNIDYLAKLKAEMDKC